MDLNQIHLIFLLNQEVLTNQLLKSSLFKTNIHLNNFANIRSFFEYSKYNMIIINKLHKITLKSIIFLILAFYIFVNQKTFKIFRLFLIKYFPMKNLLSSPIFWRKTVSAQFTNISIVKEGKEKGLVVSAHPLASEAGAQILKRWKCL